MSVASEITRLQNAKASLKSSINAKTDSSHQIDDETIDEYADFVDSIQTGGGTPTLQNKTITITDNTTTIITADSGFDGLGTVEIITNVQPQSEIDENTLLLLHFDSNYADSSPYSRMPSSTGTSISYNAGKFNNSFNLTSQSQGIVTYNQLSDLVTHDFTIDFWFYPTSFSSSGSSNGRPIVGSYKRNDWTVVWRVFVSEYQGNTKKWGFGYSNNGNTYQLSSTTELTQNQWQHLAVTYNSTTKKMELYLNGIKDAEGTLNFTMEDISTTANKVFSVGNWFSNYNYAPLGYVDEVRVSDVVRYTENFTPHTKQYE